MNHREQSSGEQPRPKETPRFLALLRTVAALELPRFSGERARVAILLSGLALGAAACSDEKAQQQTAQPTQTPAAAAPTPKALEVQRAPVYTPGPGDTVEIAAAPTPTKRDIQRGTARVLEAPEHEATEKDTVSLATPPEGRVDEGVVKPGSAPRHRATRDDTARLGRVPRGYGSRSERVNRAPIYYGTGVGFHRGGGSIIEDVRGMVDLILEGKDAAEAERVDRYVQLLSHKEEKIAEMLEDGGSLLISDVQSYFNEKNFLRDGAEYNIRDTNIIGTLSADGRHATIFPLEEIKKRVQDDTSLSEEEKDKLVQEIEKKHDKLLDQISKRTDQWITQILADLELKKAQREQRIEIINGVINIMDDIGSSGK